MRRWILAALIGMQAATGCATVDVVPRERLNGEELAIEGQTLAHVNVQNWGWYLFKFIPLVSGNLRTPRIPQFPVLFRDNVRYAELLDTLTATSEALGADVVVDVSSRDTSEWRALTLVLWLNQREVSGTAIRLPAEPDTKAGSEP
jgi:hypothetical protein